MRQKIMLGVAVLLVGGAAFNVYQRFGPLAERASAAKERDRRAASTAATAAESKSMADALLVGELARQAIRVAAERGGLQLADVTFASRTPTTRAVAALDAAVAADAGGPLRFSIAGSGRPATFEVPATPGPGGLIPYESIVSALAPRLDAEFAEAVVAAGGRRPQPLGEAALPEGVDALLVRPDPFAAFRAARLVHAAVAADGPSPARLGALARAYATFGEGMRPTLGAHAPAALARALIYAEQLVRARPDEAASYWTRAYVRAAVALPGAAADVSRARSLDGGGGAPPAWGTHVAAFVEGDTAALFRAADAGGPDAALAAHLAMRTVEFSRLDAVVVRLAELALERDPANLRAMFVAIDSAGVSKLHGFTEKFPALLNRACDAATDWPELPPQAIAPAFAAARKARYDAASRLALWRTLDAAPADAGGLPWGTLADVAREASFMLAQRRLDFVANKWSVDAGGDLDGWWPVVRDHPAATILATYARRGDRAAMARVTPGSARETFVPLAYQVRAAGFADAVDFRGWFALVNARLDRTLDSVAREVWTNFYIDQRDAFAKAAKAFYEAAPDDPSAVAAMIRADWFAVRDREPALASLAENAPQVAWALADRAAYDRDHAKAQRYYEAAATLAPTWPIYNGIAQARRGLADVEGAIRAFEAFLARGQDVGLSESAARGQAAELLMLVGQPARALPYARASAESYAGWALSAYADNLAQLGRDDEARAVWRRVIDRYGESNEYHAFISGLVYPAAADAAIERSVRAKFAAGVAAGDAEWRRCQPILDFADGRPDAAAKTLASFDGPAATKLDAPIELATVHLLREDIVAARAVLGRVAKVGTGDATTYAHVHAARAAIVVLDGNAVPMPLEAGSLIWAKADAYARAADAALIGAACERAGNAEASKAWYEAATRCTGLAAGRVYAAVRLRAIAADAAR